MSSSATSTRWGQAEQLDVADDATVAVRRSRAAQLDAVHAVVESGRWHIHGFRSPHAWLTTTTGEAPGAVRTTLHLADRVQRMPIVKERFADGILAESALRLLADAWHDDIVDAFARDEEMLAGWATTLTHRDFKIVLATWRLHADPNGAERTAQEQFESRSVHLSELLDGMGRLDGLLDPEGFRIVQEAIRALARRADGDERTAAQRRADALVAMAKQALAEFEPAPGIKRSRPKVVATVAYDDLVATTKGGTLDTNSGRTTLTAQALRRIACDAGVHRLITGPDGTILDYGRQTRTVSDTQFDALALRDHGCRILGCPIPPGGCDAHHSIHWADDGNTDLDDLVLACWYHHHWLHEQHWSIQPLGAGHFILVRPGWQHPSAQAAGDRPCPSTGPAVRAKRQSPESLYAGSMSDLPLLPEQPSNTDQVRRFGPPALIGLAALLFILQNTRSVTFNILWFEFRWPLWIMLAVFMAIGAVVFWGADRRRRARRARDD